MINWTAIVGGFAVPKTSSNLLLATLLSCYGVAAWGQGEGRTLREEISSQGVPPDAQKLVNLDKIITRGAELNDTNQFVIAYYIHDSSGLLNPPLFLSRYDRRAGKWQSASVGEATAKWKGLNVGCLGSALRIRSLSDSLTIETHIGPSAGCVLILSRDLKLENSLYGWVLGNFKDGSIVYHRNQIHFATVHPAEIAVYNPATSKDFTVFPHRPYSEVYLDLVAELDEFYKTHQDYCKQNNDPCDPEYFDSSLVGSVTTDERQHSLAFVISYELQGYGQGDEKPQGPSNVVYLFRHVNDEAKLEYREILMDKVKARYGAVSLQQLVHPEMLEKIFNGDSASKKMNPRR